MKTNTQKVFKTAYMHLETHVKMQQANPQAIVMTRDFKLDKKHELRKGEVLILMLHPGESADLPFSDDGNEVQKHCPKTFGEYLKFMEVAIDYVEEGGKK